MEKKNYVFIARSVDGYIADKDGGIDWLHSIPNLENLDMGYNKFNEKIDAIVMGRKTFDRGHAPPLLHHQADDAADSRCDG